MIATGGGEYSDTSRIRVLRPGIPLEDRALIVSAHECLEHPGLAARLSAVVGTPLERAFQLLPRHWHRGVQDIAEACIWRALDAATGSVRHRADEPRTDVFHRFIGGASGALGGALGLPGLVLELPVSTAIMLRSIADIARHEGEDLSSMQTRLACMQVFALGGRTRQDDAAETGYYGVRLALSLSTSQAALHISRHGLADPGAPALARFVAAVAARFGIPLSQKAAVQAVPIIGAVAGATINVVFLQHFQSVAHSHFTLRRLERKYGREVVETAYRRLDELGPV